MATQNLTSLLSSLTIGLDPYEALYKHLHSHPELSHQEEQIAAKAASHLNSLDAGYEVHTSIGGHGLAGVLRNGTGKTVLLRADMDALPVKEDTGLDYASKVTMRDNDDVVKPVMHACGHDFHVTALLAAAECLAKMKESWSGTLIVLFQPNEERGGGAQAMVDDGLYNKVPVPDIVLGQHVMARRAGSVGCKVGHIMSEADSFKITIFGRGGHGSMPHRTVDPVVMAASVVMKLQTVVSREVDPDQFAVVTVGSLQAGQTENIITDRAEIRLNIRTQNHEVRNKILTAVRRIVRGECEASGATKEPIFEGTAKFPLSVNDETVTKGVHNSFAEFFGDRFDPNTPCSTASEDYSILASSQGKPSCFWFFGGADEKIWDETKQKGRLAEDIPVNHSPFFAPVIQPTLKTGIDALCLGALTFLKKP
ncbi:MAG: hypothetical protein LQ343_001847 [Gyalolechia ehrenbergii]|nr:MAG: hypothetical protein LQ343_001847 [Gyalolechia ehrenbergii]